MGKLIALVVGVLVAMAITSEESPTKAADDKSSSETDSGGRRENATQGKDPALTQAARLLRGKRQYVKKPAANAPPPAVATSTAQTGSE